MNPNSVYRLIVMRFTPLTRFITTEVLTQQERCILCVFVITKDRIELFSSALLSPIKVIVAQRAHQIHYIAMEVCNLPSIELLQSIRCLF